MEASIEWVAGYLDAKAIFTHHHHHRAGWLYRIKVQDNRIDALNIIREFAGGGYIGQSTSGGFHWTMEGKHRPVVFLESILPYLRLKRERAQHLIDTEPEVVTPLVRGTI